MSVTVNISRSDRFPIGTVVKAYPVNARQLNGPPAGPSIAEATVGATGVLSIAIPAKSQAMLYAEVAGVPTYLRVADPTRTVLGTLRARLQRRKVENGV